jgi:hypothetical protein
MREARGVRTQCNNKMSSLKANLIEERLERRKLSHITYIDKTILKQVLLVLKSLKYEAVANLTRTRRVSRIDCPEEEKKGVGREKSKRNSRAK